MPARDPNASHHLPSTFPARPVSPTNSHHHPNALSPNNDILSPPTPDHQQSNGYFAQALRRVSGTGGQNLPRMEASAIVGQDVPAERNGWEE